MLLALLQCSWQKSIDLFVGKRQVFMLLECFLRLPIGATRRAWSAGIHSMQIVEEIVAFLLKCFDGLFSHPKVGDQGKVLLSNYPQISACLPVFLRELTQIVILGVCIENQQRC